MDRKSVILRVAIAGFAAIVAVVSVVISGKFASLRQFDADPTCTVSSPESPVGASVGACVRRPIRIRDTRAASAGRSGTARYIAFIDADAQNQTAQIVPDDTVFVQMFHPGDATFALYYEEQPVRIAFRQYWLRTEADPRRAIFKSEILSAIILVLYALVARLLYVRTP